MPDLTNNDGRKKRLPKLKPALSRIATRALDVEEDEIRSYCPTELDLKIAESMVGGVVTYAEIASNVGCDPSHVSRVLQNPVRCGWLSQQLHRIVHKRIGLVDNALLLRALAGDVRAIKLYYERFGEITHRSVVLTGRLDFNPRDLDDKDLDAIIASEVGRTTINADFTVKDPECDPNSPSASPPAEPNTPPSTSTPDSTS
jgi:hypothetical protein